MACERYREALADVAAGLPAPAGVEVHLATCEACRAELHVLRLALAMADAGMAGLLTAEPSPELAVRIRQAVEDSEPSPAWRFGWLWPATAAAATLLVALAVMLGRGVPSAPAPRVVADKGRPQQAGGTRAVESATAVVVPGAGRTAPVADGHDPVTPSSPGQAERRVVRGPGGSLGTRRAVVPRDDRVREPQVLVPPGEADALLRLVALVHRDRLAPTSFAAAGQPSADLGELALIDIRPLEIVPLDPAELTGTQRRRTP